MEWPEADRKRCNVWKKGNHRKWGPRAYGPCLCWLPSLSSMAGRVRRSLEICWSGGTTGVQGLQRQLVSEWKNSQNSTERRKPQRRYTQTLHWNPLQIIGWPQNCTGIGQDYEQPKGKTAGRTKELSWFFSTCPLQGKQLVDFVLPRQKSFSSKLHKDHM